MSIFAGNDRTFFVTESGVLYAWGNSDHGALGIGTVQAAGGYHHALQRYIAYPVFVGGPERFDGSPVCTVACGLNHTVAVTKSGEVWAWGNGGSGQLGLGTLMQSSVPVRVAVGNQYHHNVKVIMAVCSETRTILLGVDGSVWFMGQGDHLFMPHLWTTPKRIDSDYFLGEKIVMVSVETNDAQAFLPGDVFYALGENGGLFKWGRWEMQSPDTIMRPIKMDTARYFPYKVVMVVSSLSMTHVMLDSGYVCEIGSNTLLGATLDMGDVRMYNNALEYPNRERQRMLSTGDRHVVSVDEQGNVYAMGRTTTGAMGLGTLQRTALPVPLDMQAFHDEKIATVSCGPAHTVALTEASHIYVWGTMGPTQIIHPTPFNFPRIGHFRACVDSDMLLAFAQSHHMRLGANSPAYAIATEPGLFQDSIASRYLLGSPTCPSWLTVHAYNGICRTLGVKECFNIDM